MINEQLLNPKSIVVVGGANDLIKPRGKILKHLIDGNYKGELYVTSTKEDEVQGLKAYRDVKDLPDVELAVIAIPSKFIPETVDLLCKEKNTKAFIIISAGFSEENEEGKRLEKEVLKIINKAGASLIGPNCTGILTPFHHSIFTGPIPKLNDRGCDLISGSGATACFILESGIGKGLSFANIFSVGNSAQNGVEEILKHLDNTYNPETSSDVKLLYLENISKPDLLIKHSASLIQKGCKIVAIKSGVSDAGARAASSHTGALASSDLAVDSLLRKAGIVRCKSMEEMICIASIFMHKELKGKNIAIVSHAGGPAVMLTDTLTMKGLNVPHINNDESTDLLKQLHPGSSVANPIDFLATGTAEQLGLILDFIENKCHFIDGTIVIYGSPGLFKIDKALKTIEEKRLISSKPIYAVMPSVITCADELKTFIENGNINFPDPSVLGKCLAKVFFTAKPKKNKKYYKDAEVVNIRNVISKASNGYISPAESMALTDSVQLQRPDESVVLTKEQAVMEAARLGMPVAMKVIGPIHKTEVGGVVININSLEQVRNEFTKLMKINDAKAVLIQRMVKGIELFIGAKREGAFGHLILFGIGGIFIEVLKDFRAELTPISLEDAMGMIKKIKSYNILKGYRGMKGVNEMQLAYAIMKVSALLEIAPEIYELDINPLIATDNKTYAVDIRINIDK